MSHLQHRYFKTLNSKTLYSLIGILFFITKNLVECRLLSEIRVGSVFLEKDQEVHKAFRLAVDSLKSRNLLNETTIDFDIQYAQPHDFFHLYTRACLEVNYRIIALFGPSDTFLDKMLDSISSNLGIPLISTAPRPEINGKIGIKSSSQSALTLSLHPTQSQLISVIKDFATELKWKEISIIYDPIHGIIEPSSLVEAIQVLGPVTVHQASTDLRATLVQLRLKGARNIIVDTGVENVQSVIQATLDTGMMTKSYTYIFTILDMKSGNWSRLSYSEALVYGLNIIDQKKFQDFQERFVPTIPGQLGLSEQTRVALTLDSVELLARGLEAFDDSGTDLSTPASTSCTEERTWEIGEELLDAFSSVYFDGMTGPISFSRGSRTKLMVELLKLTYDSGNEPPLFLTVGNWTQGITSEYEGLMISEKSMLTNEKPVINKTLIITTMENSSCAFKSESNEDQGFCIDLAEHLAKMIGFNYKIKIVSDSRYGKPDQLTGQWDGMIGEVIRGEADIALADLTVTALRSSVVDFTVPFAQTSIGILFKDTGYAIHEMGTLLSPFSMWVWVSIILAFFLTSICLRLVAWLSPFQKDDIILPGSDRSPSLGQDLSWINSMWVLASTLVLRGCDVRLQAASSRTIAVVWWLFALLIIIIYASLISHWFDPGLSVKVETIDTLLKNPALEFGVLQGGSTNYFLQNAKREDLQRFWWRVQKSSSETNLQSNIWGGIDEVRKTHGGFAFIGEEINLNQALLEDCSLSIVGPLELSSFSVAVGKGSPLREKLSHGILALGESGILRQLEEKWWPKPSCHEEGQKPQVTFISFIGPLCLLTTGILIAFIIAMCERLLHHRRSHRGFFRTHTEPGNGKIAMNDTESDQ